MNEIVAIKKKEIRKNVNYVAVGIIIYNIIFVGYYMVDMIVRLIMEAFASAGSVDEAFDNMDILVSNDTFFTKLEQIGSNYIIGCLIGLLFLIIFSHKKLDIKTMFEAHRKMTINTFLKLLCVFMGMQFLFSVFAGFLEAGLNLIGYSALESVESASSVSTTFSMFIYVGLIGPVVEEVVYRGFVMKSMEKHGKVFAVVVSSVIFGVMHQNIPQAIFAMGVGIILGYVAMNYSIKWAILLHIINNCVFGDILSYALSGLQEDTQAIINNGIMFAFFVVGIVILILNRKKIGEFMSQHKTDKKSYFYAFTSLGLVVFNVACIVLAITLLTPVK